MISLVSIKQHLHEYKKNIRYCHMVYYTKVLKAIFDALEKFRQIDGKMRALTFFPREFWVH